MFRMWKLGVFVCLQSNGDRKSKKDVDCDSNVCNTNNHDTMQQTSSRGTQTQKRVLIVLTKNIYKIESYLFRTLRGNLFLSESISRER